LNAYRNRITAQLVHDVVGTHIQLRSSTLMSEGESIHQAIDRGLNDISFAYWKQKIQADHPIYVTNSRNELLRLGTFCQFMHQEIVLPRHSLKYALEKRALRQPVSQKITKESDTLALRAARKSLIRKTTSKLPEDTHNQATRDMVYRMQKADLTWVQLDDLAYDIVYHSNLGEESIEYVKAIACIPVSLTTKQSPNEQHIAREIAGLIANTASKERAYFITVQGDSNCSCEFIEQYHNKEQKNRIL
jgi:hypothetical protein